VVKSIGFTGELPWSVEVPPEALVPELLGLGFPPLRLLPKGTGPEVQAKRVDIPPIAIAVRLAKFGWPAVGSLVMVTSIEQTTYTQLWVSNLSMGWRLCRGYEGTRNIIGKNTPKALSYKPSL
jgi:hypothetical protein